MAAHAGKLYELQLKKTDSDAKSFPRFYLIADGDDFVRVAPYFHNKGKDWNERPDQVSVVRELALAEPLTPAQRAAAADFMHFFLDGWPSHPDIGTIPIFGGALPSTWACASPSRDSAEHFSRLGALLFTYAAVDWRFIPAYCFALP